MKIIPFVAIVALLASCEAKPYINSELKSEKLGACSQEESQYKVSANTDGERYEFEDCLSADFTDKDYSIVRQNEDTLIVSFPKKGSTLYKITLDINAYPKYHHILLDGKMLEINSEGN